MQAEAIDPVDLADIVRAEIDTFWDSEPAHLVLDQEQVDIDRMRRQADNPWTGPTGGSLQQAGRPGQGCQGGE